MHMKSPSRNLEKNAYMKIEINVITKVITYDLLISDRSKLDIVLWF